MLEFDQDIFLTVYLNFKYFKNYNASIFIQVTEIKGTAYQEWPAVQWHWCSNTTFSVYQMSFRFWIGYLRSFKCLPHLWSLTQWHCVTVGSKSSFVLCLTALFDELQDWFITIQSKCLSSPQQLFSSQTNLEEGKCALCDLFLLVVF